jgi:hypothetical protein
MLVLGSAPPLPRHEMAGTNGVSVVVVAVAVAVAVL